MVCRLREETLAAFARAFATLAYTECDHADPEPDCEKIAIYAIGNRPKHAARQLTNGTWISKLGKGVDIEHQLEALEGEVYGNVALIMKQEQIDAVGYFPQAVRLHQHQAPPDPGENEVVITKNRYKELLKALPSHRLDELLREAGDTTILEGSASDAVQSD